MSYTRKGVKILKAVSSGIRLQVLTLLYDKGPLSYTEIMTNLKLNQTKDAGRFAYHLKFLLKTDLVEPDVETKKYKLTDLGKMIVDISEEIERHTFKRRKIMVRTSRLAMEEFDRNKIAISLIREANVPANLAQSIARETEKRLQEFKTKYLTAPLIREIVNSILLEKGLEEYRHKLTRLGVPVYDVTLLIKSTAETHAPSAEAVHRAAGDSVIEEYTLLNVLPRDISDAYMSGAIHLDNLGTWILKPNEIAHDLRYFLRNGISKPPRNLDQAMATVLNVLQKTSQEANGEQIIDYFSLFLAPFTKGMTTSEVGEKLQQFLHNLNQTNNTNNAPIQLTLGLELGVPDFLREKTAAGPEAKPAGLYDDFEEETLKLASILLKIILEETKRRPVFNPSLVVKLRPETLNKSALQPILLEAHQLAVLTGTPYFANLLSDKQMHASYAATGSRLGSEWKEDWEIDTLQTGNLDNIAINLPRIAYQSETEEAKFFQQLDEQIETTVRALEIKHQIIKQRLQEGLLPFLSQTRNGGNYYRLENATRTIGFTGLNEAVSALLGKSLQKDKEALKLAERIAETIAQRTKEYSRKPEVRVLASMLSSSEASARFAELDAERFGWAKISAQGSKEQPSYTNFSILPLHQEVPWQEKMATEEGFHKLTRGGHITVLSLPEHSPTYEDLLSGTKQIVNTFSVGFFAYDRVLSFCVQCGKLSYNLLPKCPFCGAVDGLEAFTRASTKYQQHNSQA